MQKKKRNRGESLMCIQKEGRNKRDNTKEKPNKEEEKRSSYSGRERAN